MEHRKLGNSDLEPSVIGIGGYPFGPPLADQTMTTRVLDQARESGVNYIDTSDIYAQGQSEVQIGVAIEGHRDDFILATKFNLSNLGDESPKQRIMRKIDESLTKLKTDHIDLYQIHHVAKDIPAEEILQPLDDLVKSGKIRYVGNCNYSSWRQMEAMQVAAQASGKVMPETILMPKRSTKPGDSMMASAGRLLMTPLFLTLKWPR